MNLLIFRYYVLHHAWFFIHFQFLPLRNDPNLGFCLHYFGIFRKHRMLVAGFFNNASGMLRPNGEIHVNHKTSAPFCQWNLEELASRNSLLLLESVPFKIEDYPGYNNKRGDGSRCDEPFRLGECSTFRFIFSTRCKKISTNHSHSTSVKNHTTSEQNNRVKLFSGHVGSPVYYDKFREEFGWLFSWYFTHVEETFGLHEEKIVYNVHKAVKRSYDRFVTISSGRPSSDYIEFLRELRHLSLKRIKWLEQSLDGMRRR